MTDEQHVCPFKQTTDVDCLHRSCRGPVICNCIMTDAQRGEQCPRYYHIATLHDIAPYLRMGDYCCNDWAILFLRCAEDTGCSAGAFDIQIHPNDGKDVWRNFERVRFRYCPYCGKETRPSPEELQCRWDELKAVGVRG